MEWSKKSEYNSWNSYKGLCYYEQYKKIVDWLDNGNSLLPPPRECNIDPYAECNARCYFCIGQRYLRTHREEVGEIRKLPTEYLYKLVDFLANWGVSAICYSGGGDPSLHEGMPEILLHTQSRGMQSSFVTNGWYCPDNLIEAMMVCRWVCFSVNAADGQSQKKIMGRDMFDTVCRNIKRVTNLIKKTDSKVDVAYRMLILPENQYSFVEACKIARELGVADFNVRPADFERSDIEGHRKLDIDIPKVLEQFEKCHELETPNFRVTTVIHKFDEQFHVKHQFAHCYGTLILPILQDGNGYLCNEKKMEKKYLLGSAMPPENILTWWGSERHREMMKAVIPNRDCSRCTQGGYFRQVEEVVLRDSMCINFP